MPNANLYALLSTRFLTQPDTIGIEQPDADRPPLRFADMDAGAARYANCLVAHGVSKGDRVLVQVDKSPEALLLYLACLRSGAVYVPLNPRCTLTETAYVIADVEPRLIVAAPSIASQIVSLGDKGQRPCLTLDGNAGGSLASESRDCCGDFPLVACAGDEPAVLMYTSGTTGRPKAALLTHANLAANAVALHRIWGFREGDVLLHMLPLFHTHGLFVACHPALLNASRMLFCDRFDSALARRLLPHATLFMGIPTFYVRLLNDPAFAAAHCANIRLFTCGSAPLRESTLAAFKSRSGHTIVERYGMSECGISTSNPLVGERRPGSVGLPLPGLALRIANEQQQALPAGAIGEVQFSGPNVCKGYWNSAQKSAASITADGYFKSGDLGSLDQDGYLYIVGRSNDLVISGGFNVYPKEVENAIDALPGVAESAVIGIPDPDLGEQVIAIVVPSRAAAPPNATALIALMRSQLSYYKVPKHIFISAELPRNSLGKVQKHLLRQHYTKQQ